MARKKLPAPVEETKAVYTLAAPRSQGTYAIFDTPKGGLHLVYREAGAQEDTHLDIPAFVVNMANRMASGEDPGMLGRMLGRAAA